MSDVPEPPTVADKGDVRAASDGYVAGTFFARWHPSQDTRTLVRVLLAGPVPKSMRDFFDGFITGAEAEHLRQTDPEADALQFTVKWTDTVEIGWGETEWVVGPQPGPWRPKRT